MKNSTDILLFILILISVIMTYYLIANSSNTEKETKKNNLIIVPPLHANGWVSLSDNTILVCASTSTTQESLKDDDRFDPYKWGDVWTVKAR